MHLRGALWVACSITVACVLARSQGPGTNGLPSGSTGPTNGNDNSMTATGSTGPSGNDNLTAATGTTGITGATAATGVGHVVYTLAGRIYRVLAQAGATPQDLTAALGDGASGWVNISADGQTLVFAGNTDCSDYSGC